MSRVGRGVAVGPGHPLDLYMRVGIQSKNYCETNITIGGGHPIMEFHSSWPGHPQVTAHPPAKRSHITQHPYVLHYLLQQVNQPDCFIFCVFCFVFNSQMKNLKNYAFKKLWVHCLFLLGFVMGLLNPSHKCMLVHILPFWTYREWLGQLNRYCVQKFLFQWLCG